MKIDSEALKDEVRSLATSYKFLLDCGSLNGAAVLTGQNYIIVYQIYQKLTGHQIKGVPTLDRVRKTLSKLEEPIILDQKSLSIHNLA